MKRRIITALVLIPLVLAALFWTGPTPIGFLAIMCACLGADEAAEMLGESLIGILIVTILMGTGYFLVARSPDHREPVVLASLWLIGVAAVGFRFRWKADWARRLSGLGAGLWITAPLLILLMLHGLGQETFQDWEFATSTLLAIVPLWGGDSAGYFIGRKWGKHPLAPAISPKKSWEGAVANLVACIVVAVPLAVWIGYKWPVGMECGFAAGIFGQLGDLFESYVKRKAEKKDSGTLLPGHGGILDRIDSLLFTAPVVALILTHR